MIVEDNEMNLDMLTRRLLRAGFEVVSAPSAVDIVTRLEQEQPALVLMDLGLPDVDGFSATSSIRKVAAFASLPIIALTAHAMAEDKQRALQAGCDAFETKPLDFSSLLTKIETLLRRGTCG
jgi:two-component system cell cycle response regulator DivK